MSWKETRNYHIDRLRREKLERELLDLATEHYSNLSMKEKRKRMNMIRLVDTNGRIIRCKSTLCNSKYCGKALHAIEHTFKFVRN
jgi:hypothetical protein